jgi:hypothetical protein
VLGFEGIVPLPNKLAFDYREIVLSRIGIAIFDRSIGIIVPLNEIQIISGWALILWFALTTFDTLIKVLY